MGKDFWGGMFDFNGDGKTTWDEEMLGLSLLEEDRKRTAKNLESKPSYKYKELKTKSMPTIKAVPEVVDETNYKSLCSEYRTECICAVVALLLMLIPAGVILWAVYSTYDPKNSASDFITIVFTLAGLVYGGVVFHTTFKSINTSVENLNLVKERYTGPELPKKKFNAKWLLLLLIPLFIIGCFLFSTKDDVGSHNNSSHNDNSYHNNYSNSGYSNNTYSGNYGFECILSHCDFKAKEGSPYCGRHGCCKDGCRNQKDPMVHCCNTHNCAEPGCGAHRYDYAGSQYCQTHYVHHYND